MEDVCLMAGKLNTSQMVRYWKVEKEIVIDIARGDYAIVENQNGFDLVEIIGIINVDRKNVHLISNTKYENMKKIKMIIEKEKLKPEQN